MYSHCSTNARLPLSSHSSTAYFAPKTFSVVRRCFGIGPVFCLSYLPYHSLTHWNVWPRPRVAAPSKTCGLVRSSRRRWHRCRPGSASPTFGRVVHAGASTPAWCPVYRLHECPQPGVVRTGMVPNVFISFRKKNWIDFDEISGR